MLHIIANTNFFLTAFVMERLQDCEGVRVIAHGHRKRGLHSSTTKLIESVEQDKGRACLYCNRFVNLPCRPACPCIFMSPRKAHALHG